ncbi:MAG: hypothetical protein ACLUKN_07165 [Bacilli bacterium]
MKKDMEAMAAQTNAAMEKLAKARLPTSLQCQSLSALITRSLNL